MDVDIGRSSASMIWIPPLSFGRTPVFRRITAVPVLAHGCTTRSTAGISTWVSADLAKAANPEGEQTGPRCSSLRHTPARPTIRRPGLAPWTGLPVGAAMRVRAVFQQKERHVVVDVTGRQADSAGRAGRRGTEATMSPRAGSSAR